MPLLAPPSLGGVFLLFRTIIDKDADFGLIRVVYSWPILNVTDRSRKSRKRINAAPSFFYRLKSVFMITRQKDMLQLWRIPFGYQSYTARIAEFPIYDTAMAYYKVR